MNCRNTNADQLPRRPESLWPLFRVLIVTALLFCSMAIVSPSADTLVRERFGLDNRSVSTFFAIHSVPSLLMLGIFAGVWSDKIRRRLPLAIIGTIGTGLTTALIPAMGDFRELLALRFIDGATGIAAFAMLMTRAVDLSTPETRARVMGIFMVSVPVGYLCGSFLVAGLGTERVGLTFALVGIALMIAGATLLIDVFQGETVSSSSQAIGAREIFHSIVRAPGLALPYFFGFVDKFTFGLITLLTGLAVSDRYRLDAILVGGSALGLMWLAYLLASYPSGAVCRRFGSWNTVAVGSAGYGLALVGLVAFDQPAIFVILLAVAGGFIALQTIPVFVLVGDLAGTTSRATAMAGFNMVGSFGIVAGLIFAGIASREWGYLAAFAVGGVLELVSAAIAIVAGRKLAGNSPPAQESPVLQGANIPGRIQELESKT